jgi:hypothetical protein
MSEVILPFSRQESAKALTVVKVRDAGIASLVKTYLIMATTINIACQKAKEMRW